MITQYLDPKTRQQSVEVLTDMLRCLRHMREIAWSRSDCADLDEAIAALTALKTRINWREDDAEEATAPAAPDRG